MSSCGRIGGATWALRSGFNGRVLSGLKGFQSACCSFSTAQKELHCYAQQEALRIFPYSPGLQNAPKGLPGALGATGAPEADGGGRSSAPAGWPADIKESVRRAMAVDACSSASSGTSTLHNRGDTCSFISQKEMERQLVSKDAQAFWARIRRVIARPVSGAAALADDSFGDLEGANKGTLCNPVVYKRYVDGMTAAHHYPSRLLPASTSTQILPLFYVTPFDLQGNPDAPAPNVTLGFKGTELFKKPTGMQQRVAVSQKFCFCGPFFAYVIACVVMSRCRPYPLACLWGVYHMRAADGAPH